jgi:hypothetical protein
VAEAATGNYDHCGTGGIMKLPVGKLPCPMDHGIAS